MRQPFLTALTASLALASAPAVGLAQDACTEDLKVPAVGGWAEYESTIRGERNTMRYALVGQEERDGQKLHWVELSLKGKKPEENVVYQALVPKFPFEMSQVKEIILKTGTNPAMKVGKMMMRMAQNGLEKSGALKFSEFCKDIQLVGTESVTVPAGAFQGRHYKSERWESETWVASNAPFGMVKSTGRDHDIQLYRYGYDAKPSITETPKEMP